MKQPLAAILIAPDAKTRRGILSGKKNMTIREGERDYRLGPVMLCCHEKPWVVMADITRVRSCRIFEVSDEECRSNGFKNWNELLAGLHRHYPRLKKDSRVTMVWWNNVRGNLVEQYKRSLKKSRRSIPVRDKKLRKS